MTVLAIDTSTKNAGVALWEQGALVRATVWRSQQNHTVELMPAVDNVLRLAGVKARDLAGIAVALGPGGFSALRAGMSVVKGMAFTLGLPVVGVSTLEAEAYPYRDTGLPLCPLLEVGRGAVAWARFRQRNGAWNRLSLDRVGTMEELLAGVRGRTLFCGEGVLRYGAELKESLAARALVVANYAPMTRLHGVASLGWARLATGEADPLASLQPRYLRAPAITQPSPPSPVKRGAASGNTNYSKTAAHGSTGPRRTRDSCRSSP
ncbi:MAG: tRNA (adenosine(37)-N6)-threonylcarbamoyltransferase complex dimerization subunit type 1 TsaB [Chloroflexi bacterium]|nr:tRNA (adenosine(37)-N6)-threonylcarbamoyltransferase complex dimerization subunit type 1 TsaB [Chloroflexota bacterium]